MLCDGTFTRSSLKDQGHGRSGGKGVIEMAAPDCELG